MNQIHKRNNEILSEGIINENLSLNIKSTNEDFLLKEIYLSGQNYKYVKLAKRQRWCFRNL